MQANYKKILRQFQCDFNRGIEEDFAQVLTEKDYVRLFFINENQAFTDGRNIVIDPAVGEVYADKSVLRRTEDYMKIGRLVSPDPWYALKMMARGQNIHECLHIIYSNFPNGVKADERSTTKARAKTLAMVSNIIEDAFIEAAGCSEYDNLELYLTFERVATLFSTKPIKGTVDRKFEVEAKAAAQPLPLLEYLDYMAVFLLYPMIKLREPSSAIEAYVAQTKELFLEGSACGNSDTRYDFVQRIFDIIEPLIPESEDIDDEELLKILPGYKTHADSDNTISTIRSKGKTAEIIRRLFTDLDGNEIPIGDFGEQTTALITEYQNEKRDALDIILAKPVTVTWSGTQFDCAAVHKDINIIETKLKPNLNLRSAYKNVKTKYQININSYSNRFTQLLKARIPVREEKRLFGSGITSKRLADVKKRYWYRNAEDYGIPDIAIMLLIDGSGSMTGARRENAIISSVILHEVLKKQGINHAIVEHRGIYGKLTVEHNILIDFEPKDEEKFNLLSIKADQGTREGLSLYWAEKYLAAKTTNEIKLIIVLSDGVPAHGIEGVGNYLPPVSLRDTANAASKIIRKGTKIIAVALDEDTQGRSCYDDLKEIYPSVIACTDLKQLTGQLLSIISKNI